jgi:hypothetical protein
MASNGTLLPQQDIVVCGKAQWGNRESLKMEPGMFLG